MRLIETALPEVKIIEPAVFADERGFFLESWNAEVFAAAGLDLAFVQDNHSRSARHVLRGLHYQIEQAQGKVVRVTAGRAWDVAVDIRRSSPSFGQWVGVELSAGNKRMLWVPPGFAHGFLALEDGTDFLYKCTAFRAAKHERSLNWADPTLAIAWPLDGAEPNLSGKDRDAPLLGEADLYP